MLAFYARHLRKTPDSERAKILLKSLSLTAEEKSKTAERNQKASPLQTSVSIRLLKKTKC